MNEAITGSATITPRECPRWLRAFHAGENGLVVVTLVLLVILPLAEILLRKFHGSISGSSYFVQHFTLVVCMLGGAIAARDGRLLSLSPLLAVLKGRSRSAALVFSSSVGAAISALLCAASWKFLMTERTDVKILAYGIPFWWFEAVLPLGFAAVALRLVWHASDKWSGRGLTLLLGAAWVLLAVHSPVEPARLMWPALILLAVATVFGMPVFATLGGAAMIFFWSSGRPITLLPLGHYSLVTDPILPSLPLFTVAGFFLAEGGVSKRLVRVFEALVGQFRGGPAIITALVCAFFTSFTGASGVTILALGGLLLPVLLAARYSDRDALGLITSAGSLGLLFPPSLPVILYAIIAQNTITHLELPSGAAAPEVTINKLFLGGLLPGVLLVILTAWWGIRAGPKDASAQRKFDIREAVRAISAAKWELLLPVVALVVLLGGFATPVEAAAVTALCAFITQTFVHRDLKLAKDVPRVMTECGLLIGGVLLILGVAMGLTSYLIFAEVPTYAVEWIKGAIHSKWVFLLLLNVLLLLVGCLMNIFSAIVVVVPIIVPMGLAYGVDPIHLGIIFLANMELGYLAPPVGMNLLLSSYRFGKPMTEVARSVLPMLLVLLVGVLLITYVPALSTTLPRLIK